jgi:CubicO group peptidase (beta-lactamase class C family)
MYVKSGVIYVKENQEITTFEPRGYKDYYNELPIDKETRFPTASAGKVFVAVAILQLIEQGKITLDSTLKDTLKIDLGQIDPEVTIYQLLTHTSGVPDYCDESKFPNYADLWTDYPNYKVTSNKDLLPLFINEPMMYEKGTKFQYNNSAYVLLGLIIEELTNKEMDQHLKDVIFNPLNMKSTGYFSLDRLPKNCANAYILDKDTNKYYTNIYSIDKKGSGAGGAYTNAIDINLFWNGLFQYKLLSKETVDNMLNRHQDLENWGYGLGIWLDESNNPMFIGSDPGANFITYYNLSTHKQITVISNFEEDVFKELQQLK